MNKTQKSRRGGAGREENAAGDPTIRHHARTRRRLLQSLTVGGAAVTVKALPEKWTKPVTNTVMVPAHAQSTVLCNLACEVDAAASQNVTGGNGAGVDVVPGTPINTGGATVGEFPNTDRVYFDGITATVGGPGCGQPSLALDLNSLDPRFGPVTGGNPSGFDPGTGVATFNEVSVAIDPPLPTAGVDQPTTVTANLTMTFTAAGAAPCVIPISFQEDDTSPPPAGP